MVLHGATILREGRGLVRLCGRLRGRSIITSIELVPGDAKQRKPDMAKVTLVTRPEPLVQGLKDPSKSKSDAPSQPPTPTDERPSGDS